MDFIQRARADGRPFFVQLSHYAVHSDIIYSSESYSEMESLTPGTCHSNVGYAAMLLDLDRSIGRLLTFYANQNLMQNTFLFFTSDNGAVSRLPDPGSHLFCVNGGAPPGPPGTDTNLPLARGKWDLGEGGIRVPFFASGPGIPEGTARPGGHAVSYDSAKSRYHATVGFEHHGRRLRFASDHRRAGPAGRSSCRASRRPSSDLIRGDQT